MEANEQGESSDGGVQTTSKLSPYVKPFVPRRLQTETLSVNVDAESSARQSQQTQTQRASSTNGCQPNYGYASIPTSPRMAGYAAAEPRHAHHYIPFMSGPYALQDYQTGYGLYPYPVFMFEEVAAPGSFVAPGTFVCPRASLQRRNPRKKVFPTESPHNFPTRVLETTTATTTTTTKTTMASVKGDVRPMVCNINSARKDALQNGDVTVTTTTTTVDQNTKPHKRSGGVKEKPTGSETVVRSNNKVQEIEKRDEPRQSKIIEREPRRPAESGNNSASVFKEKKESHGVGGGGGGNRRDDASSYPKSKSFAEIIRQKNSDNPPINETDHRGVLCRRNSNVKESSKTDIRASALQSESEHVVKRQLDDSSLPTRYRNGEVVNGKPQHNRWTPVLPRSCRKISENSDSSALRSQTKKSDRPRSNRGSSKTNRQSKKVPNQDLVEPSNGVPTVPAFESNKETNEAVNDDDTWTEVRSNRRSREPNTNRRHARFTQQEKTSAISERLQSSESTGHDQNIHKTSTKVHDEPTGGANDVRVNKLCNEKTLKTAHNMSDKSKVVVDADRSEQFKSVRAENQSEATRLADNHTAVKPKPSERSRAVDDSENAKPVPVEAENLKSKKTKKKRKTEGQLKQGFKDKLKALPSVQGKVLTVTEEFYNQYKLKSDGPDQQHAASPSSSHSKEFHAEEFPFLNEASSSSLLLNVNSDDSWSDVEASSETTTTTTKCVASVHRKGVTAANKKSNNCLKEFPALGSFMEPLMASEATSYSSLLKKNFWSLPPRITPTDSMMMMRSSNSPAFWEKLLAESSMKNLSVTDSEAPKLIAGARLTASGPSTCSTKTTVGATDPDSATKGVTTNKSKKPKTKSPVQISLINLLKKKEKHSKKNNRQSQLLSSRNPKSARKVLPFVANILDSTAPLRRRGKERERPTKKKPSALKKVILKERTEKKLIRIGISSKQLENCDNASTSYEAKESVLPDVDNTVVTAKQKLHSCKFREYCNQMLNPEIDGVVQKLISDLIRFHDRLYQRDPVKAKIRRRMVIGLREVGKHLKLKKIKCLILAPNLERIQSTGGLDDAMYSVIALAQEQNIPFVFALGRRRLGRACLKKVPVSCVGIFNYDGSDMNFTRLCELAASAREAYQSTLSAAIEGFAELSGNGS